MTRIGGQSGSGRSAAWNAGVQYLRRTLPIGVPGPTRHSASFSSGVSMRYLLLGQQGLAQAPSGDDRFVRGHSRVRDKGQS